MFKSAHDRNCMPSSATASNDTTIKTLYYKKKFKCEFKEPDYQCKPFYFFTCTLHNTHALCFYILSPRSSGVLDGKPKI